MPFPKLEKTQLQAIKELAKILHKQTMEHQFSDASTRVREEKTKVNGAPKRVKVVER